MAITSAVQEGKFIRQLIADIQNTAPDAINLFVDNKGAIDLANNPVNNQRSKHIDIRHHFIRSEVKDNVVILNYIPSQDNISDLFTKPVSKATLKRLAVCN